MGIDPRRWLAACALVLAPIAAAQTPREDVGLVRLVERLGPGNEPTGAGVVVAQVEVASAERYSASPLHPQLAGKRFEPVSGSTAPSVHATWVALFLSGLDTGIAPGIESVRAYEVLDWLGAGFLNGSGPLPPAEIGVAVVNCSWVGDAGPESNAFVRKLDHAIASQSLAVFGGTANGRGGLDFPLLTHSFNGICVGRADGRHGAGETSARIDGPGRMKPELVGPAPASSFATPIVAGAAALLVQTAREHPALSGEPAARRPELLKAVLMAGARHRLGWSNGAASTGPGRGATDRPLDPLFGADVVDVDRSHWILTGGRVDASEGAIDAPLAPDAAWAWLEPASGESRWLRFELAGERPTLSVIAAWSRRVRDDFAGYELPDLDLELFAVGPAGAPISLVGAGGLARFAGGNVASWSRVDNVEHLYVEGLQPGEYLLRLRRAIDELPAWPVAVAWELAQPAPLTIGSGKPTSLGSWPRLAVGAESERGSRARVLELAGGLPGGRAVLLASEQREDRALLGGTLHLRAPERVAVLMLDERGAARVAVPADAGRLYQVLLSDAAQPDGSGAALSNALGL